MKTGLVRATAVERLALVLGVGFMSVACGANDVVVSADDQNLSEARGGTNGWVGLYGTESTQFIMAVNVKSEEPLVFAVSASRHNFEGITADAHDLTAEYDDAAKTSATFKRGDCTLKLKKASSSIDVEQVGACTSIGVHREMTLDASLSRNTDVCWDVGEKSFKVLGSCASSPGFESSGWTGLWGTESTQFIMALNVKSEEPFVFALSASRQNFDGITVDAADLEGTYDDANKDSVTFERGDCTIKLKKTASGEIEVAQSGPCTTIEMHAEMTVNTSLRRVTDVCWDAEVKSFATLGHCRPAPGF